MNHTPEPWKVGGTFKDRGRSADGHWVFMTLADEGEISMAEYQANADRIVACVNALQDMNPDAIPELLSACEALVGLVAQTWGTEGWALDQNSGQAPLDELATVNAARAAIAKARP